MARPKGVRTKLTPEVQDALIEAVREGVPYKFAAEIAGISERTLHRWLTDAKKAGANKALVSLTAALKKAQAEMIQGRLRAILAAADKSWQSQAWILERLYPDYFALQARDIKELLKALKNERNRKTEPGDSAAQASGN